MSIGIYGIFDRETDDCLYIGMSKNLERRWKDHLKLLKSKNHKRQDFVEWYHANGGIPDLLDFRVLEECEDDNNVLNSLEIKWFNKMKPKYFGKKPSLSEKWEQAEETKEKLRKTANSNLKTLICEFCDGCFKGINAKRCKKCRWKNLKNKYCYFCKKELNNYKKKYCENCCKTNKTEFYNIKCKRKECNKYFNSFNKNRKFCSTSCANYERYYNENLNKENLEKLYIDQKLSTTQIAEMYNTTAPTVRNSLKRFNIKLRTRTDGVRIARKNGR